MPLVSVVVPTYNRLGTLAETLASLAAQTFRDFEVLVVNDAGAPVEAVVGAFPELAVQVIRLPENRRAAGAIAAGVDAARGALVMLCDDDDVVTPCHLKRMVAALASGADLVYADAEVFAYDLVGGRRVVGARRVFAHAFDADLQRRYLTIVPSGTVYRRALHATMGPMDERLPVYWDWDFVLRLLAVGAEIVRVPVASVGYAFGGHNTTADHRLNQPWLERLAAKHGLDGLKTANFQTLLDEPELAAVRRRSERVWDGRLPDGRYVAAGLAVGGRSGVPGVVGGPDA